MLYTVKSGDTLGKIARSFNTTVDAIMEANVICNPDRIFKGEVLIIPVPGLDLPKSGGSPLYVVLPGDSLFCLAKQFHTTVNRLARNNQIRNRNLLRAYTELMVLPVNPNAASLKKTWEDTPDAECLIFEPQRYGIYYLGTFEWYALGLKALNPLLEIMNHRCSVVRYYAILSLGRIARDINGKVRRALRQHFADPDPAVAEIAKLSYRRLRLAEQGHRRIHLLIETDELIPDLNKPSLPVHSLASGTEIIVLRWHIPSPTGQEGPKGDIQIYDQVRVVNTGKIGFIARRGNNEINYV